MKRTTAKNQGFTLVEIMIVVAIIGLLAAIAIPNFVKARTTSQQNACINNLRLVRFIQAAMGLGTEEANQRHPRRNGHTAVSGPRGQR